MSAPSQGQRRSVRGASRLRRRRGPAAAAKPAVVVADDGDDGPHIFYKDWGSGRPIALVHAWALQSDFWEYVMMGLVGEGFRTVAHDRRGHGRSGDPGTRFDYDRLADDLAAVITGLDRRGITLVGHSMGGGEVIRYLNA